MRDENTTLSKISEWVPAAPSLYFYISGPPVGLSSYLGDAAKEANLPWGRYTFASVYRFLSKFGLAAPVPFLQEFYSTPEAINTCTFLREIHSDFGPAGIFIVPFLLGATAQWLWRSRTTLFRILLLAHLYLIIFFSFTYLAVVAGQWIQRLVVLLIVSLLIERVSRPVAARGVASTLARSVS